MTAICTKFLKILQALMNTFIVGGTFYLAVDLYKEADRINTVSGDAAIMVPVVLLLISTTCSTWCGIPSMAVLTTILNISRDSDARETLTKAITSCSTVLIGSLSTVGLVGIIWFGVRDDKGMYIGDSDKAWEWYLLYSSGLISLTVNCCFMCGVAYKEERDGEAV